MPHPRSGPSAEQQTRARLFARLGLIDIVHSGEWSPSRMADKLMDELERTDYPRHEPTIDTTGGQRAAGRLAELLVTARTLPTAYYGGPSGETLIHG